MAFLDFLKNGGGSLLGGVGSLIGNLVGTGVNAYQEEKNRQFQEEQNALERERADSSYQRMTADAYKSGLSPFGLSAEPLGQTSAPQYSGGTPQMLGNLANTFADFGHSATEYVIESAKLEQNAQIEKDKLALSDKIASVENALKEAQTKIANLNAELLNKENLGYEETQRLENELKEAQRKKALADEAKTQSDIVLASNEEERKKKQHELDVKLKALELEAKIEALAQSKQANPLILKKLQAETNMSDATAKYYLGKLDIEVDNLTLEAMKRIIEVGSGTNKLKWKQPKKLQELNKKYGSPISSLNLNQ